MKHLYSLFALTAVALLGGCITPAKSPSEAVHLKLEVTDSPRIAIEKVRIDRHQVDQSLYITGYIVSHPGVLFATDTHLDILLKDASGIILRKDTTQISLRESPQRPRNAQKSGSYHFHIAPLPSDAASIEVRAHDEPHENKS